MSNKIENLSFDEERALYNLTDTEVINCSFEGEADGESALKECRDVFVKDSSFYLRYPLWHAKKFNLEKCFMDITARAPLWYSSDGVISSSDIKGVKCLRECENIKLEGCRIDSPEFGWRCRKININDCSIVSEYLFFECRDLEISRLDMKGKYSFQYIENMTVRDSVLDTKDAFWHTKNVTVINSTVKGEYLGWYSEGLTFINCKIIGTQPLCYCKNLKLENCTMEGTDLSFEYSDVTADIKGYIESVKNPASGKIKADKIGDIIMEGAVISTECEIIQGM